MRENEFINKEGQVVLKRATAPPAIDEKLGEEEGTTREKNDALIMCRKYIGQMMWLTTRTRPGIAACLGILASLMVRRPQEVKNGPLPCPSPLTVQTYCDASFAPGGGRSRSGILVLLVDQKTNRASLLLWQSRRQTLTALSAPEAEVVALSEALMPAITIHESCRDIGLEAGLSPQPGDTYSIAQ